MKVYRYLSEKEYNNIVKSNMDEVGGYFKNNSSSSFVYKQNVKYVHFFKNKESMTEIQKLKWKDSNNYYFCTFNIPAVLLISKMGIGYYNVSGYDVDYKRLTEFCIPSTKLNAQWLVNAELDTKKHEKLLNANNSMQQEFEM